MRHEATSSEGGDDDRRDPPRAKQLREALVARIAERAPWPEGAIAKGADPRAAPTMFDQGRSWDPRVIEALRRVPRHLFAPGVSLEAAYADEPQPIGASQTISQPTVVALMSQALCLSGKERVLEIGTGSAYQAAILGLLAREVLTIERIEALARIAADRLAGLGFSNVHVRIGDGYAGWPEAAPFDRILFTAAAPALPEILGSQLIEGGLMVGPVGSPAMQELFVWKRHEGRLWPHALGAVRFVPMLPGEVRDR